MAGFAFPSAQAAWLAANPRKEKRIADARMLGAYLTHATINHHAATAANKRTSVVNSANTIATWTAESR